MNRKLMVGSGVMVALALQAYAYDRMFGYPGANGGNGVNGNAGGSYPTQQIAVAPRTRPVAYNFSGAAGQNGGDGAYGSAASNCFTHYDGDENIQGAPGGSGGNAGEGGQGGDGADVTVSYTPAQGNPLADLRNVSLYLAGGAPGISGNPGQGQPGCYCRVHHWVFVRRIPVVTRVCDPPAPEPHPGPSPTPSPTPVCHDVITYVDQNVDHYCNDGAYGSNGQVYQASAGSTGRVTLVPTTKPTSPDAPSATITVGQLPFAGTLTQDNWNSSSGAQALFAPGSVVADGYTYYAGRTIAPVKIVWNAKRSTSDLAGIQLGVALSNGVPILNYDSSQLWTSYSKTTDASGATVFSIDVAAKPSEALQVSATLSGNGADTIVTLKDTQGLSEIIGTSAYAKIESKGILWHTHWDAPVPTADLETINASELIIHVGKFYPSGNSGDLKPGKELKVTLTITRSLGNDGGSEPAIVMDQKLSKQ